MENCVGWWLWWLWWLWWMMTALNLSSSSGFGNPCHWSKKMWHHTMAPGGSRVISCDFSHNCYSYLQHSTTCYNMLQPCHRIVDVLDDCHWEVGDLTEFSWIFITSPAGSEGPVHPGTISDHFGNIQFGLGPGSGAPQCHIYITVGNR